MAERLRDAEIVSRKQFLSDGWSFNNIAHGYCTCASEDYCKLRFFRAWVSVL